MNLLVETVGWTGALLVLGAYGLLSLKKVAGDSTTYQGMNIGGSLLLAMYAFWKDASASLLVNIAWMAIGVSAIVMSLRSRKRRGD